jgi:hypothetical protein
VIDPSIAAVLRSRFTILRFFYWYGAILLVLITALYVLAENLQVGSTAREAATSFLGHFAATIAILMVTYAFYASVTPRGLRDAKVLALRSGEIAEGIVDLRVATSDYWFWGRSGSYFRDEVLPKLDELARKERRHVTARIVIPNTEGPGNAMRYAAMKRSLGEAADECTLAANILATSVAAIVACARNPYLHVCIGQCATVPVLRYDVSNSGGLVTRDAQKLPAILVNSGNSFFEMLRDAVENELAQSRRVTWDSAAPVFQQAGEVSIENALSAIEGLPSYRPPKRFL